jgi:hypothetical protein
MEGPDIEMTFDEAVHWVKTCRLAGGGWRMPWLKELRRLYVVGAGKRNLDPVFSTTGWYVWANDGPRAAFDLNKGEETVFAITMFSRAFGVRDPKRAAGDGGFVVVSEAMRMSYRMLLETADHSDLPPNLDLESLKASEGPIIRAVETTVSAPGFFSVASRGRTPTDWTENKSLYGQDFVDKLNRARSDNRIDGLEEVSLILSFSHNVAALHREAYYSADRYNIVAEFTTGQTSYFKSLLREALDNQLTPPHASTLAELVEERVGQTTLYRDYQRAQRRLASVLEAIGIDPGTLARK